VTHDRELIFEYF